MFCIECGTRNPENAKFCKKCGHSMPRPDLAEQSASESTVALESADDSGQSEPVDPAQRARVLLLSAFRLREAGDLDGSLDAASQVTDLQPRNVAAHALLSTLHEHKGDIDKAIAEREKVLELAPDSDADREKLEMLKRGIRQAGPRRIVSARSLGTPVLFEKLPSPTAFAVGAFLLVAIVGSASVLWHNRGSEKPTPNQVAQNPAPAGPFPGTYGQSPFVAPRNPATQPNTQQPAPTGAGAGTQPQPEYDPNRRRPANSYTGLDDNRDSAPAQVSIPNNGGLERDNRTGRQTADPDPSAFHLPDRSTDAGAGSNNAAIGQPTPSSPPRNPGRIEIILAPDPSGTARGGTRPPTGTGPSTSRSDSGSSADSRSRRAAAQEYQMKGDYGRAATEYKRALEGAGDDAGIIHQKIALCYQRLDQRDSAIAHYNDAIRAFQQLKASGRNVDLADQGIRASEAGIANCK